MSDYRFITKVRSYGRTLMRGSGGLGAGFESIGKGFTSFTLYPQTQYSRRQNTKLLHATLDKTDAENIASDWKAVGEDLKFATDEFENIVKKYENQK